MRRAMACGMWHLFLLISHNYASSAHEGFLFIMQFYEEACLVRQKFVMGDDQTVQVSA